MAEHKNEEQKITVSQTSRGVNIDVSGWNLVEAFNILQIAIQKLQEEMVQQSNLIINSSGKGISRA